VRCAVQEGEEGSEETRKGGVVHAVGAAEAIKARRGGHGGGQGVEGPKKKSGKNEYSLTRVERGRIGILIMRANVIVNVGTGRPLPGFIWGRGGVFTMISSEFKLHITPMPSICGIGDQLFTPWPRAEVKHIFIGTKLELD
jgi:hypothetical protein